METFAYRQRFITLHPPLKKLTTRRCDAPIKAFQYSDLQERGSEMIGTTRSSVSKFAGAVVFSLAILVWSGCGGSMNVGGLELNLQRVVITPAGMTLRAGDSTQFSAKVTGNANQTCQLVGQWSRPTGNATVGTIDATGKYKAPASSAHTQHGEDQSRQQLLTRLFPQQLL